MSGGGCTLKVYSSPVIEKRHTAHFTWYPHPRLIQRYWDDQKTHVSYGTSDDEGRWTALVADSDWDEHTLVGDDDWDDAFGDDSVENGYSPEERYINQQ